MNLTLKFDPSIKVLVEDYFRAGKITLQDDGYLVAEISFPEDEWVYGWLLSYGEKVEVLKPDHIREILLKKSLEIAKKYQKK